MDLLGGKAALLYFRISWLPTPLLCSGCLSSWTRATQLCTRSSWWCSTACSWIGSRYNGWCFRGRTRRCLRSEHGGLGAQTRIEAPRGPAGTVGTEDTKGPHTQDQGWMTTEVSPHCCWMIATPHLYSFRLQTLLEHICGQNGQGMDGIRWRGREIA